MTAEHDESQLIKLVKSCLERSNTARTRADDLLVTAGKHLLQLKSLHDASGRPWKAWVNLCKDAIGISKSRASELMQIAGGEKTPDQVRAATNERRARREKSLRSNGETKRPEDVSPSITPELEPEPSTPRLTPQQDEAAMRDKVREISRLAEELKDEHKGCRQAKGAESRAKALVLLRSTALQLYALLGALIEQIDTPPLEEEEVEISEREPTAPSPTLNFDYPDMPNSLNRTEANP